MCPQKSLSVYIRIKFYGPFRLDSWNHDQNIYPRNTREKKNNSVRITAKATATATILCRKCCCLCVYTINEKQKKTRTHKRNRLNKIHRNSFLTAKKLILTWVIVPLDLNSRCLFHNIINQERFFLSSRNSKTLVDQIKGNIFNEEWGKITGKKMKIFQRNFMRPTREEKNEQEKKSYI